jgi:hypothetical protein
MSAVGKCHQVRRTARAQRTSGYAHGPLCEAVIACTTLNPLYLAGS